MQGCVFCGGRQIGKHAGKECSVSSDNKTHNCSGHGIEEQRGGRGDERERKVGKGNERKQMGGRRENKGVEGKEKEDENQRNMKNKEQKKKGMKVKTKKGPNIYTQFNVQIFS
jgi:hypothetical protein